MDPDLTSYRWVVVNSSAGKDSQAMLDLVVERCDEAGVPRSRLVVAHADLGRVEWPGTRDLAGEQARHYGLAFFAVERPQGDLLRHIEARGKAREVKVHRDRPQPVGRDYPDHVRMGDRRYGDLISLGPGQRCEEQIEPGAHR